MQSFWFHIALRYQQKIQETITNSFWSNNERSDIENIESEKEAEPAHTQIEQENTPTIHKVRTVFSASRAFSDNNDLHDTREDQKSITVWNKVDYQHKKIGKTGSKAEKKYINTITKREKQIRKNKLYSTIEGSNPIKETAPSKLYISATNLLQIPKKWGNLLSFVMKNESSSSLYQIQWSTKKTQQGVFPKEKQPLSCYPELLKWHECNNKHLYYREENDFFNEEPYFFLNEDMYNSEQIKTFLSLEKETYKPHFLPRAYSDECDAIFDPFFTAMDSSHHTNLENASIPELLLIFYGAQFYDNTVLIKIVLNALCKRNASSPEEEALLISFIKSHQELYMKDVCSFLSARIEMNNLLKEPKFCFLEEGQDFTFIFEQDGSAALKCTHSSKELTLEFLQEIIEKIKLKIVVHDIVFVSSFEISQLIEIGAREISDLSVVSLAHLINKKNIRSIGKFPQCLQKNMSLLESFYNNKESNYFFDFSSSMLMNNEKYALLEYERIVKRLNGTYSLDKKILQHPSIIKNIIRSENRKNIISHNKYSLSANEFFLSEIFEYCKDDSEKKASYFLFMSRELKKNCDFFSNLIKQDISVIKYALINTKIILLIKNIKYYVKNTQFIKNSKILELDTTHLDTLRLLPLIEQLKKEKKKIALYGIILDPININLNLLLASGIQYVSDLKLSSLQKNKAIKTLIAKDSSLITSKEFEELFNYPSTIKGPPLKNRNNLYLKTDSFIPEIEEGIDKILSNERKNMLSFYKKFEKSNFLRPKNSGTINDSSLSNKNNLSLKIDSSKYKFEESKDIIEFKKKLIPLFDLVETKYNPNCDSCNKIINAISDHVEKVK